MGSPEVVRKLVRDIPDVEAGIVDAGHSSAADAAGFVDGMDLDVPPGPEGPSAADVTGV